MTYQAIASVYDQFMFHVDYNKWADGLEYQWKQLGMDIHSVLDAGCGTGSVLLPLAERNYQVYGIDISSDMLAVCWDKLCEKGVTAFLMEMDIREIILPEKVDTAICLCDTLNYLTEERDLEESFKSFYDALRPGGSFIFDMRTPHYYENVLADNVWVQREGDMVLIWENDFSQKPIINIDLTFFVEQNNGLYRKYMEEHEQKCYPVDYIKELLERAGFYLNSMNADLFGRPLDLSQDERMYFIAIR